MIDICNHNLTNFIVVCSDVNIDIYPIELTN